MSHNMSLRLDISFSAWRILPISQLKTPAAASVSVGDTLIKILKVFDSRWDKVDQLSVATTF